LPALKTQNPYRFYDTGSFLALSERKCPDISAEAVTYLVDSAASNTAHGAAFVPVQELFFLRQMITRFHAALKPLIPNCRTALLKTWIPILPPLSLCLGSPATR
jgi:hypothetical protein